ncbi:cupredoxin domain-containing protein [Motilimonas cestriensis]|uniref:Cupredoxin domain-containing protein n=1 Tax=Motilimonas cestriensis TaxID=2742685 RepID=A0ABS8W8N2_9GAMM|nr:cupredoxin domain-containing protein [Motilimonas cestriensis]MCE2593906.1 cupredoxin domain-containing protein [Motilimonas cestriensis]
MIVINLLGLVLIGFIVWWFWLYQPPKQRTNKGNIEIEVKDGVYTPAQVKVLAGQPFTLRFIRRDPSLCAEVVQIPTLSVSDNLPTNQPHDISLPELAVGKYEFHCQMKMYRGVIHVVEDE